jgi:hypothetical protein
MQSNFKKLKNSTTDPQETAIAVLGWLANEPEMLNRFLALTGLEAADIRQRVNDPDFLAGLLDFLVGHEPTLMAFCAASGTPPEAVAVASAHFSPPGLSSGEY